MIIKHNLGAMNANRMLNVNWSSNQKTVEKLSSGYRINRSADDAAGSTITKVKDAIDKVSQYRSMYGSIQNRLEHTINNLDNVTENTQSSESRIRDTDMAKEMVQYTNNNILAQAGQMMLAQMNQSHQHVLALLQ